MNSHAQASYNLQDHSDHATLYDLGFKVGLYLRSPRHFTLASDCLSASIKKPILKHKYQQFAPVITNDSIQLFLQALPLATMSW